MKKLMLALVLLVGVGQSGCAFLGGAAVGALGTSAGYEINAHSKMNQLEVITKPRESPVKNTNLVSRSSRRVLSFIRSMMNLSISSCRFSLEPCFKRLPKRTLQRTNARFVAARDAELSRRDDPAAHQCLWLRRPELDPQPRRAYPLKGPLKFLHNRPVFNTNTSGRRMIESRLRG